MGANQRIGILTGGGDVPGLNAVIKSVVYRATEVEGFDVVGIRKGWQGLTHLHLTNGSDAKYAIDLNRKNTRVIDRAGGTFLHSSRVNPAKLPVDLLPAHKQGQISRLKEVKPGSSTRRRLCWRIWRS